MLLIFIAIGLYCRLDRNYGKWKEIFNDSIAESEIVRLSRMEAILKKKKVAFNELTVILPEGITIRKDLKENITINRYILYGAADILLTAISHKDKIIEAQFIATLNCSKFSDPDRCREKIKNFYKITDFSYMEFGKSFYYEYYSDEKSRNEAYNSKNISRLSYTDKRVLSLLHFHKSAGGSRIGFHCGSDGEYVGDRILIQELFKKKDFPTLLRILYGHNLYGRIYAAEALLYAERTGYLLEEQDKVTVEVLKEADYEIDICSGCLTYTKKTGDHFLKIEERLKENDAQILEKFISYY